LATAKYWLLDSISPLSPPNAPFVPGINTWWSNIGPPGSDDLAEFNFPNTWSVIFNGAPSAIGALAIGAAGGNGGGNVIVDGTGSAIISSFSPSDSSFTDIGVDHTGTLTLQNGAHGSFPSGIRLAGIHGIGGPIGSSGNISILSGATLSVHDLLVGTGGDAGISTIRINGAGSAITQTSASQLRLGTSSTSVGRLIVGLDDRPPRKWRRQLRQLRRH
jgi:hypothetical protein